MRYIAKSRMRQMPIVNRVAAMHEEITAWRRDLHAHPELGFDVHRTAGIVVDKLKAFGCDEIVPGIGKTGVVGVINGRKTASGKVVGLRADMDALPIQEMTGVPYASKAPGKMHACGHDGHTAMLLGAAKYLCETRNFDGTVVVVFQPNEEGLTGSLAMIEDGLIERFGIQQVYGMHTSPTHELGKFALCAGPMLAACDKFTIEIAGKGSHAGRPHEGVDPVVVAAQTIMALQTIASRNVNPLDAVVVPIGGGGLCAGVAAAVKLASPQTQVFGVEPEGADSMHRSFAAGSPQSRTYVRRLSSSRLEQNGTGGQPKVKGFSEVWYRARRVKGVSRSVRISSASACVVMRMSPPFSYLL
jgi:metal-dependent amidase/aminoacylase/carboxypeptidase family protein